MSENQTNEPTAPTPPSGDEPIELHAAASIVVSSLRKAFEQGASAASVQADTHAKVGNRVMPVIFGVGPLPVTFDGSKLELRTDWAREAAKIGDAPPARRGTTLLHDLESFIEHVKRHAIPGTTALYLDTAAEVVTAIYNGAREGAEGSGWGDDRAAVKLAASPEWAEWTAQSGKVMSQAAFADWIEEHLEEIAPPEEGSDHAKPLELLSMARDLQIHTAGTFKRKVDTRTGTGSLVYSSEHGEGSTKIPRAFGVALRPWEGADAFRIEARLRFSLEGSTARFTYTLHRVDEVWRTAWRKLAADLGYRTAWHVPGSEDGLSRYLYHPVYLGAAPAVVTVR